MPTSPKPPDSSVTDGQAPTGAAVTVVLGRVLGAFGIRGWIKIRPFTENADGLLEQSRWVLSQHGVERIVQVVEAKPHGVFILAHLREIADRGQAEALRGADVTIGREQLPEPDAGEYYWTDLIGLSVRNLKGQVLGQIVGLISAPAHDVLRVQADSADAGVVVSEQLIPFVEPILRSVDLESKSVTVDWGADW